MVSHNSNLFEGPGVLGALRNTSHHFRLPAPADVSKAIADCFRGMWCWGLDEAAGMVLSNKKVHVSCRSLAYEI